MKLKEFRNKKGMTQKEVAKYLNVAPTTYLGYEKETSEPTIETLIRLSKLFNTSLDNLIGNELEKSYLSSPLQEEINNVIEQLSPAGQGEVLGYAKRTLQQEKQVKENKLKQDLKRKNKAR